MKYTATELFPGWYNAGISKEATSEELDLRRKAINEILKIKDVSVWNNLLKVYLGITVSGSEAYSQVIELVKKGDENFSIQNDNLVRLLAGCAIAFKMDEDSSLISSFLSLSLLTTKLLPLTSVLLPELRERASNLWIKNTESPRSMDMNFKLRTGAFKSSFKIEVPVIAVDEVTTNGHSNAVNLMITNLQKDLNTTNTDVVNINNSLEIIKQNFIALSEETNILWWLFAAYSSTLKKAFSEIPPGLLSIVVALELSQLTCILPGIGGIESFIRRALTNSNEQSKNKPTASQLLVDTIKGVEVEISKLLPSRNTDFQVFTPLLYALHCYLDHEGKSWVPVYIKNSYFDITAAIEYESFSSQLYKELMLVAVCEKLKV